MNEEELVRRAIEIRANAYAPYSNYQVGAALLTEEGSVFVGCNVENVSFGLTVCAERNAVFTMVAAGHKKWMNIAIATRDGGTPCGACLQVLTEFGGVEGLVHCVQVDGEVRSFKLGELLPHAFDSNLG